MKRIHILAIGSELEEMERNVEAAVVNLRDGYVIEKVSDAREFLKFGVMYTPALVIDGEVKVVGKVPSTEEIIRFLGD